MRQLFIFNEFSRAAAYGIGTYISQLIPVFQKENIELYIVYLRSPKRELEIIREDNMYYLDIPEPVVGLEKMEKYKKYARQVAYILDKYIKREVLVYMHFNFTHHSYLNREVRFRYPACRTLHTVHYFNWAFLLLGNTTRFRYIASSKPEEPEKEEERKTRNDFDFERNYYNELDQIICLSQYACKLLTSCYKIPSTKIFYIPNGLKDEQDKRKHVSVSVLKKRWGFGKDEKLLLFVGRLDKCKGVSILLDAFCKLVRKESKCRLVLVGEGEHDTFFSETYGAASRITFLGKLSKEQLCQIYRISYAGILPSYSEQCSYVAIEMMMFGLPMIITALSGLNEMGQDGYNCFKILIKEEKEGISMSSEELKELMIRLVQLSPERYRQMSGNSRKIYEDSYNEEIIAKKYKELILETL